MTCTYSFLWISYYGLCFLVSSPHSPCCHTSPIPQLICPFPFYLPPRSPEPIKSAYVNAYNQFQITYSQTNSYPEPRQSPYLNMTIKSTNIIYKSRPIRHRGNVSYHPELLASCLAMAGQCSLFLLIFVSPEVETAVIQSLRMDFTFVHMGCKLWDKHWFVPSTERVNSCVIHHFLKFPKHVFG